LPLESAKNVRKTRPKCAVGQRRVGPGAAGYLSGISSESPDQFQPSAVRLQAFRSAGG